MSEGLRHVKAKGRKVRHDRGSFGTARPRSARSPERHSVMRSKSDGFLRQPSATTASMSHPVYAAAALDGSFPPPACGVAPFEAAVHRLRCPIARWPRRKGSARRSAERSGAPPPRHSCGRGESARISPFAPGSSTDRPSRWPCRRTLFAALSARRSTAGSPRLRGFAEYRPPRTTRNPRRLAHGRPPCLGDGPNREARYRSPYRTSVQAPTPRIATSRRFKRPLSGRRETHLR